MRRITAAVAVLALTVAFLTVLPGLDLGYEADGSPGATLYVGSDGVTYSPIYPTLAAAVTAAGDYDIIVVTENLLMKDRAYVADKHLTIKGINSSITVTRSTSFNSVYDARGDFNPGMLEVATDYLDDTKTAGVRFENITFDDANNPDGFTGSIPTAPGGNPGWASDVYDSVLSAYSDRAYITLGPGAKIINVGGASALRVAGATLTLEPGSHVDGSKTSSLYGIIWVNGGTLNYNTTLNGGTIGTDGSSNFIRLDGTDSTVNFGGKITNNAVNGRLVYFQIGGSTVNFLTTSEISGNHMSGASTIDVPSDGNTVNFKGKAVDNDGLLTFIQVTGKNNTVDHYGEISGNDLNMVIHSGSTDNQFTLRLGSKISGNNVGTAAILLNYQGSAAPTVKLDIYGEVSDNVSRGDNGGAMYVMRNVLVHIYDGAKITGNVSPSGGGAIYLSYASTLTMDGGEISGNKANGAFSSGLNTGNEGGGGVFMLRDSVFIMNGGKITGNTAVVGGGVLVASKDSSQTIAGPKFIFNGGEVSGNTATALGDPLVAGGMVLYGNDIAVGPSGDASMPSSVGTGHFIQIGKDAVIGENLIGLGTNVSGAIYGFDKAIYPLDRKNADLRIGTILPTLESSITASAALDSTYGGYAAGPAAGPKSSLWMSTLKTSGTSDFVISYPAEISPADRDTHEYVAAIRPLDSGANPIGAIVYAVPVREADGLHVTVPLSSGAEGYAVVIMTLEKYSEMTLTLTHAGDGVFDSGGSTTVTLRRNLVTGVWDILNAFTLAPGSGWYLDSVILTAGDGAVTDKSAAAVAGALSVSYVELASGSNVLHAVFLKTLIPVIGSDEYRVTVDADPTWGGDASSDRTTARAGVTVTLAAVAADGYSFSGWRVNSGGVVLSAGPTASFTMPSSNVHVTALFTSTPVDVGGDGRADDRLETGGESWSLVSLLFAIAGLVLSIVVILWSVFARDEDERRPGRLHSVLTILAIVLGILAAAAWFLLDDLSLPMDWVNRWTPVVGMLLAAAVVLLIVRHALRGEGSEE
ncbi:MAG: hypothetical protein LBS92_03225 [Candidatus Methanoplasma sp.]|jgi:hypothetical protein|nr:hypothetical protein [Candidatus Methanoplasma sp.]